MPNPRIFWESGAGLLDNGMGMRDLTTQQLRDELELSQSSIGRYIKAGCPCTKDGATYLFDRGEVAAWMAANKLDGKRGRKPQQVSEEIKAAQLRVLRAKAEKSEIELSQTKGELVLIGDVEKSNIQKILTLKNSLLGLPASISPQLIGLSGPEIQARLEQEFKHLLEGFSKQ